VSRSTLVSVDMGFTGKWCDVSLNKVQKYKHLLLNKIITVTLSKMSCSHFLGL